MSDNVIDFSKEKAKKGNAVILNMIQKNRTSGLERADSALKSLDDVNGVANEPLVEARLRALETGLRGLTTAVDAISNLCDVLGKDLVALLMNLDQQMAAGALYGMHLQTVIDTLKEKNLVTNEELEKVWVRLQHEMKAAQQRATPPDNSPISPEDESPAQ